jgi:Flp pilus assembly pilin Flp
MFRGLSVKCSSLALRSQRAQALVEYALIIVLVAIVVIAALTALAGGIGGVFNRVVAALG